MGPAACELCKRLQSVDISQTEISEILGGTFAHCSQLQQLRLAKKVRRIGREAFLNCASLGEIHAPPTLLYIARHAFAGCIQLCTLSRVGEQDHVERDVRRVQCLRNMQSTRDPKLGPSSPKAIRQ